MKKNKIIKYLGIGLAVFTLISNIQYALLDYGLETGNLGYQIFAQTGGTSGGGTFGGGTSGGGTSGGDTSGGGTGTGTGIIDWWNSKIYSCVERDCSVQVGIPGYQITYYGKYDKCEDGSDVAHCWNCKSCNAGPVYGL